MMQQDHDWVVELIPAYAIGAADEEERAAVDAHVQGCAECQTLVQQYGALDAGLLFAAPPMPAPARLGEDLRRRLSAPAVRSQPRRRWDFLRGPALALGAAALVLLVLTNVYWVGRVNALQRQADEIAALAQAPGITLQVSDDAGSLYENRAADGVVYTQPGSKVALLCVYALPNPGPGKTYQAWLVQDGQRVSGGTFDVNGDGYGVLIINSDKAVSDYQQLGITVEPAGGSPAPTSPRVMGGAL